MSLVTVTLRDLGDEGWQCINWGISSRYFCFCRKGYGGIPGQPPDQERADALPHAGYVYSGSIAALAYASPSLTGLGRLSAHRRPQIKHRRFPLEWVSR